nr:MAG TPA: hypothetical protein [Caudoviricetes sp.]
MNYNNWRHDFRDCGNLHRFTDFINNRCYDLFIFAVKKVCDFYIKSFCDCFQLIQGWRYFFILNIIKCCFAYLRHLL